MNDQSDKANEQVDRMLRRWGAEQAGREASVPPVPIARRAKRSRWSVAVYWISTAVAAGILVAAGVLYFGPKYFPRDGAAPVAGRARSPAADMVTQIRKQLARTRGALDTATAACNEAEEKLAQATRGAEAAKARIAFLEEAERLAKQSAFQLQDKLAAEKLARKADQDLLKTRSDQARELADARKKLTAAAGERKKLQGQLDSIRPKLTAAVAEQASTRRLHDAAVAAGRKAENDLVLAKARQAAMLADLQRAYMAITAPGQEGLPARQVAARRAKMTQRCAELRKTVDHEPTRQLLDKLEAVLVRLDLVSAGDRAAADAFATLLRNSRIIHEIDRALADPPAKPEIRGWLMEAKLILAGADHVG